MVELNSLFKKLQENLTQNLQTFGFFPQISGIEAKISVFRAFQASADSVLEANQVIGSQWFNVSFLENSVVKNNKFTAAQCFDVILMRSDFCTSRLSLARLNNVTFNESRFENNKFTRVGLTDFAMIESDFTENIVTKTTFSDTVINGSRLTRLILNNSKVQNCSFDFCDWQGIEFENCTFNKCRFTKVKLALKEPVKISNREFVDVDIENCNTIEEFYKRIN